MARFAHRRTGRIKTVKDGSRHETQLDRHRAWQRVDQTEPAPAADEPEPTVDPDPEGVRHLGGPWYEIVIDGEQVEKVSGKQNALDRYDELTSPAEGEGGW